MRHHLHIVSLSGGFSSAVAAIRVIQRYGKDDVRLWFADTSWEDEDLYAFLDWFEVWVGMPIVRYQDGRTPLQVAEDQQIIPNSMIAPCTIHLKLRPFVTYVKGLLEAGHSVTVYIGYNWSEPHRMEITRSNYAKLGVECVFPLVEWSPVEYRSITQIAAEWGCQVSRMYLMGYSHNNCGGRCVKQGIRDWLRTLHEFPERYTEVEAWEAAQRCKPGRENYAIAREQVDGVRHGLPLSELRRRTQLKREQQPSLDLFNDGNSCMCNAGDPGPVLEQR